MVNEEARQGGNKLLELAVRALLFGCELLHPPPLPMACNVTRSSAGASSRANGYPPSLPLALQCSSFALPLLVLHNHAPKPFYPHSSLPCAVPPSFPSPVHCFTPPPYPPCAMCTC